MSTHRFCWLCRTTHADRVTAVAVRRVMATHVLGRLKNVLMCVFFNPAAKVAFSAIRNPAPEPLLYEMAGWLYEMGYKEGLGAGGLNGLVAGKIIQ